MTIKTHGVNLGDSAADEIDQSTQIYDRMALTLNWSKPANSRFLFLSLPQVEGAAMSVCVASVANCRWS